MTLVAERLRVDVIAGADIKEALSAAKELAGMSSMVVEFEYNGSVVRVAADTNIDQLEEDWQKARARRPALPFTIGPRPPSGSPLLARKRQVSETARISDANLNLMLMSRFLLADPHLSDAEVRRIWDALPENVQTVVEAEQLRQDADSRRRLALLGGRGGFGW